MVCSWILVLKQIFRAGSDSELWAQVISLAYPVGDVVLITIVIYTALRIRQGFERLPMSLPLVAVGLVAFAVADSGFSLTALGKYSSGNGIDIGWFVGYSLMLLAAVRPASTTDGNDDLVVDLKAPMGTLFPSVAVGIALATSVAEFVRTGYPDPFISWVRTIIMVLLVTRQVLTLRENRYLTEHLEHRVAERTSESRVVVRGLRRSFSTVPTS